MKITNGGGSVATSPHFKDVVVLSTKEKPLESVVSCDCVALEEPEQSGLNCTSGEDRSREISLKCLVDSLRRDLETLKEEQSRLRDMELEAEHIIATLQSGLRGKDDPESVPISVEELESLRRKVEESGSLSKKKLADVMTELERLRKSESKALAKLEIAMGELEDVKSAKEAAVKRAKLTETSKAALVEELRRCFLREREKDSIIHTSAWAAETKTLPGRYHRLPRGGIRRKSELF